MRHSVRTLLAIHGYLFPNVQCQHPGFHPCLDPNTISLADRPMTTALAPAPLRLTLLPNGVLPEGMSWRIHEGYIRSSTWDSDGETVTLGLWGPGDLVSASTHGINPLELQCLTTTVLEQVDPSVEERGQLAIRELLMAQDLLLISRVRSAEKRLLDLLIWICYSFGQVNSQGHRLSLKELNLTHRTLAELCGLTRVTVTKLLSRFRTEGHLVQVSSDDFLILRQP